MNMTAGGPTKQRQDLPEAILKEAAIRHARLRDGTTDGGGDGAGDGSEAGASERAALERWLDDDPRHRQAFDQIERLWSAMEAPVARTMAEEQASLHPLPPRRRRFARLAAAACLIAAVGAAVIAGSDQVDSLRADYATATGERKSVALADGSRVMLNTGTAMAVDLSPDRRDIRLFRGEAWFEVSPDADRPFTVKTPMGAVRVTGTRFDVRLGSDKALVRLMEGRVALTPTAGALGRRPVALEAGQQASLSAKGASAATAFDRTAAAAWRRGQIVFYDAPLAAVVAELNRYRPGRIVVADNALQRLKISGVFSTDDTDAALDVIEGTLPVRIVRLTDYLVLLR